MLRVLDLFSGIGGFSLGLERTGGFETVAFCEIEPYCRQVLARHWPEVPIYDDVRELTGGALSRDGISVDVICGGFPCQDLSVAGKRAGLEGARSGLWGQYARLIGELRPKFVIVENVPGLLSLGMGTVLGDLSSLGYDAIWDCIPASAIGANHRRDRVWLIAYPRGEQYQVDCHAIEWSRAEGLQQANMADAPRDRRKTKGKRPTAGYADGRRQLRREPSESWLSEPDVGRVADGVPARLDRLRALGNAVVPQIPEIIGRAIIRTLQSEETKATP
jgi:DNA (cytosine-5)-methyltransferase 1